MLKSRRERYRLEGGFFFFFFSFVRSGSGRWERLFFGEEKRGLVGTGRYGMVTKGGRFLLFPPGQWRNVTYEPAWER